ncbi:DUF2313 domain-containing protein [Rhizobium sp. CFBP 8762]|uniref:putative phage tail protein n=1 Tax=Rhizobium sp. CFBP 8762 TaxID=2775279 RepID=UPI001780FF4B|nr:putative phage tail protein [Rhizobium sp. CFBP 8762]MBD8555563.1 DUF2313 domain-containing protein [Rhizobium sp. CFBP 8762]
MARNSGTVTVTKLAMLDPTPSSADTINASADGTVYTADKVASLVLEQSVAQTPPWDALANPVNNDLIGAALAMWPQGAAWGSPDGQAVPLTSMLARFTRVLVDSYVWLYARAFGLARESTVQGIVELLDEWELDYGLPGECGTSANTFSERIRALAAKVASQKTVHPLDFLRIAYFYGFEIEIEEPAVFECGFSECGGEHTVGDPREEIYWIVHVRDLAVDYFRCGESECGQDPLFSLGEAERLLCILRSIAPAWTVPVLA